MAASFLSRRLTLLLAALGIAAGAWAQTPAPADPTEEIVVTGRRAALTSTLKAVLTETGYGQLGRYEIPVCPGVSGMPEAQAVVVVGLIRANAEAAGARLAPEGCRPNAVLAFVSEPALLVNGWRRRDPSMFGTMTDSEVAALAASRSPIISWRVVETMRHDGVRPDRLESVDGQLAARGAMIVRNALATRSEENVRQDIQMSFAVIDSDHIRGKTLQQLADIATLHLFLDLTAEASERAGPDSILSLFAERPAGAGLPPGMSPFDRGMLSGMYREPRNNFAAHRQRGRIVREISRQLGE